MTVCANCGRVLKPADTIYVGHGELFCGYRCGKLYSYLERPLTDIELAGALSILSNVSHSEPPLSTHRALAERAVQLLNTYATLNWEENYEAVNASDIGITEDEV